jgi:hypothetical protein
MKVFELTQLNENQELIQAFIRAVERYIEVRTNRNTAPNVNTTSPTAPSASGGELDNPISPDNTTDNNPSTDSPQRPEQPEDPNAPNIDSVAQQAQAQQTFADKYPTNTFVQGLPNTYYQAVEALSSDLNPQNVKRLEDAVENDTPKEIVQRLHTRLISNQGYPKSDLQAAVDEGTGGGFSQMEVDGAKDLLDYLRRLEIRINE